MMHRSHRISEILLVLGCSLLATLQAFAESVEVEYRGLVQLDSFDCTDVSRSSVIKRVCYDKNESNLLLNLSGTYYQYCEVPSSVVSDLLNAPSMGTYYGNSIKGKGGIGPFDCRGKREGDLQIRESTS